MKRGSDQLHKFLVAQLNLLVQMCKGENTKVIRVLQGALDTQTFGVEIDFTLVMSAIKDKTMKERYSELRAVFIEILKGELGYNTSHF